VPYLVEIMLLRGTHTVGVNGITIPCNKLQCAAVMEQVFGPCRVISSKKNRPVTKFAVKMTYEVTYGE